MGLLTRLWREAQLRAIKQEPLVLEQRAARTVRASVLEPADAAAEPTIAELRELLATSSDAHARHFQFAELESQLYQCRDLDESALTEYDEACVRHDAEMESICKAFMAEWGQVPLLDTYRQMAIRQQTKGDWAACQWWAERGLALYSQHRARQEAVDDLVERRDRAAAKLRADAGAARAGSIDPCC